MTKRNQSWKELGIENSRYSDQQVQRSLSEYPQKGEGQSRQKGRRQA